MGFGGERLKIDRDMAEEIGFHVEMRTKEYEAEGLSPEEARRKALGRFGDPAAVERRLERLRTGGRFRRLKIGAGIVALLLVLLVGAVVLTGNTTRIVYTLTDTFPKRAPFSAIRWEGETPDVRLGGTWYRLVAVDGIEAEEIVSYCRDRWPDRVRKRFEEDLVEVLYGMGRSPGRFVSLELEDAGGSPVRMDAEMTEENRWELWFAANRGELR